LPSVIIVMHAARQKICVIERLDHLTRTAALVFSDVAPAFVAAFPKAERVREIYEDVYIDVHRRWVKSKPSMVPDFPRS